jgi:predicted protein tyrosine phosphatase
VCKLLKTLYGLYQSPREWYEVVYALMARLGFSRTHANHAAFIKKGIVILIYINDIFIFMIIRELMDSVKKKLLLTYSMTDIGPIQEYLNMEIK